MKRLTVVVPVKNEAKNVISLTRRIHAALKKASIVYDIIFIDDNSSDDTVKILRELREKYPLIVRSKKGKPGKAYSILEGAHLAKSEFVAMIDGDLQYPPELLPQMYDLAVTHGVAVGNRTKRHTNFIRKFVSKSYRYLFGKVLMGMDTDVQSGIKVFRREIISHLSSKDVTPWTLDMPLLHTARELGYSAASVDMEFLERANGQSNIKVFRASTEIGVRALKLRMSRRKIYPILSDDNAMKGSGLAFKKKRYITHTKLHPKDSAIMTVTANQRIFISAVVAAIVFGLVLNPFSTVLAFTAVLSLIYFIDVLFSGYVLMKSLHFPPELVVSEERINELNDKDLPIYSVLCPLYKEAHILPQFVEAMETLDWPKKKLEVLLLLEEDDTKTIEAARAMNLPSHFTIVVVPHSFPKSKPKACNYGLSVATGEYVVIYDAEDKPDPLQLKKVYLSFLKLGKKYGCIQCKLNYFNSTDNLLTRLFTAEYSLWFDIILPGLQSIDGIIPLGGTSNHFRREDLMALNAWDPFNVTEDADLGMRLFKNGYKTAIVDSTTLEEANSRVWNWIRQRSRWIKGYFQTYLVHMRNPIELFRTFGFQALVFQLVIGMRMTFMLINPLLWLITIAYFAAYKIVGPTIEALFPPLVFYMAGFALVVGNFMYLYNYMIGCAKRGHWGLVKFVFLVPLYWIITSVAAVMALWQLITKPHYWEKTNHGLNQTLKKVIDTKEEIEDEVEAMLPPVKQRPILNKYLTKANISIALLILATLVNNFFGFLYNAYLGRELQPEQFGIIGLIGSFLYISQVLTSGLGRTVTYKSAKLLGKHGTAIKSFWSKTRANWSWISLAIGIAWLALTPVLMKLFNSTDPVPFVLFAPLWSISILSSIDVGYLNGNLKFTIISVSTVVESILKFVLAFIFVSVNRPELVYYAIPLSALVVFLIGWIYVRKMKVEELKPQEIVDLAFPRKFFATSVMGKISSVAFLSFDVLLAKLFLSPYDAGLYALLSLIGKMIYFLGTLFAQFITPMVSKAEGEGKNSHTIFNKLILATLGSSFVGFIFLGLLGNMTVPFLFGEKVLPILPFLVFYTAAMIATTCAINIVSYHQIKNHNLFPLASFLVSVLQVVAIIAFHNSLSTFVWVMIAVCVTHLVVILLLHVFYHRLILPLTNFLDLLGLFRPIPQDRKQPEQGKSKILVFNWRDTRHVWAGGAEIYIHEIAKKLVKDGNQVTIFCGNDGKHQRHETLDGVRIVRRGGFYTVYLWAFLYYVIRFRGKYDFVIDVENGVPFFTPLYIREPKFLLIHHVHQEVFRENLRFPFSALAMFIEKRLMPWMYSSAKVVTVSESSKKDIVKLGFSTKANIDIVSPGIDLASYKSKKKTLHPSFIYLGRLKRYKNINIAVLSFAEVVKKYPKATLYIVGEGDTGRELRKMVTNLGLDQNVIFTNRVSEKEKIHLLAQCWVCLQPSSFEGWGITVIEANACGTPVIASNTNGLKDSVVDGKTGILVPVKNVSAMSTAMQMLITDKRYLKKLTDNAKSWADNFDWQVCATKFSYLLDIALNNGKVSTEVAKETI